ncbi:MAG TPA: GDP-mannose 4,6-dehydratase [Chloroflexota bacterium]|nr:GDP-mannose 4,6-dehydratase [Chloroflexota bacterium]
MRVLITGATGFVGSALAAVCVSAGDDVHGTNQDPPAETMPGVTLHAIDLLDAPAVDDLVEDVQPDVIYHLAAQSSVAESLARPLQTHYANIGMQFNVLEAVRRHRSRARVVVTGSSDEYGRPRRNPVDEDHPLEPITPYAVSKVTQDVMAYQYAMAYGLETTIARPFVQLGPRRSDRFVAGAFARQIAEIEMRRRPPVIDVGNVDLVRDFTDVRDVARALRLLAHQGLPAAAYNVASGQGHTLRELLSTMLAAAGTDAEIRVDPARVREGEAPVIVGSTAKLFRDTGWSPQIPFEQSARDTLAWWTERLRAGTTAAL